MFPPRINANVESRGLDAPALRATGNGGPSDETLEGVLVGR
jgi:hypothetical protein